MDYDPIFVKYMCVCLSVYIHRAREHEILSRYAWIPYNDHSETVYGVMSAWIYSSFPHI